MKLNLSKRDFLDTVKNRCIPPLYIEIPFSDPCVIYESLGCSANSILLESVKGPYKIACYSFIAFDPYLIFRVKDGEISIGSRVKGQGSKFKETVSSRPPLERLKELVAAYPQKYVPELPPFQGGAIGVLSYDFVRYIENIPKNAVDDLCIPDAHFFMADKVIAFDHQQEKAWLIVSPGARDAGLGYGDLSHIDWSMAYEKASNELLVTSNKLKNKNSLLNKDSSLVTRHLLLNYEMSKEQYMDIVRRAKEYIAAGDIFQANLSQRISAEIGDKDPWEIYKVLRKVNPSPFAAYADFGDYQIVSSSPERLIRVKDGIIETRPIAGTRPRGKDFKEDEQMRVELLLNEKERAEHIMLIDLERNDIGRVSRYGSVAVDELMITEDYSHVIHIVSNVRGILEKGKTYFDVIKATFPGGTITGVPKVRCMEIIDELEPVQRGPYTGSLGYIGFSGNMDLNIIIRTFVIKDGFAYVQAGAGIVADSDPERENYEHKHQELSPEDATKGLHKMSVDICKSLFRTLASEGIVFSDGFFKTLVATYTRTAQDMLKRYEDDAAINGLIFDRHAESLAVETFTKGIKKAAEIITEDPLGVPLISSWDRVTSAIPDILIKIREAVEEDNKIKT